MIGVVCSGFLVTLLFSSLAFCESVHISINKKIYKETAIYDQGEAIKIQLISKSTIQFSVLFLDQYHHSFLYGYGKYQTVVVGIDYQVRPGTYSLAGFYQFNPGIYFPIKYRIRIREIYPRFKNSHLIKRNSQTQHKINWARSQKEGIYNKPSPYFSILKHFIRPVPNKVTNRFGAIRYSWDEIRKKFLKSRYHPGTDYRATSDKLRQKPIKIFAINDGQIIFADENEVDGKMIVIDHGNGISSSYLHLSSFFVSKGAKVNRGQKIGLAGKTGATDAIHLHLVIRMDNGKTIVNPEKFFAAFKL